MRECFSFETRPKFRGKTFFRLALHLYLARARPSQLTGMVKLRLDRRRSCQSRARAKQIVFWRPAQIRTQSSCQVRLRHYSGDSSQSLPQLFAVRWVRFGELV